jgi:hypothetical protein
MDQAPSPAFEKNLEADLRTLSAEIKSGREKTSVVNYSERELVKEAIRAFPGVERGPSHIPPPGPAAQAASSTAPTSASAAASPLPDYAQSAPPEVKLEIEYLLDVALEHGIGKALSESQKSPYYVQDAFHDALAGKLYPELQRRGIVK